MQKFLKGQRIQLEGVIKEIPSEYSGFRFDVRFDGGSSNTFLAKDDLQHAKIIAEPEPTPKFSKEQVAAIEERLPRTVKGMDGLSYEKEDAGRLYEFLDANTE
jgi:hypothetical protein